MLRKILKKDLRRYGSAYILILPVIIWYILFHYKPLAGILIAFKDFRPALGIWESPWADQYGLQHFIDFFQSYYFKRILVNTLRISFTTLLVGFPAPIILALLLNEVQNEKFKKLTQTISYLPHFVSLVIVCELVQLFVSDKGVITQFLTLFGRKEISLLSDPQAFVPIYAISNIWEGVGWGSIIYLSALSGIDPQLYEAAKVDGAGRWKQTLHITLPGISTTVITMLLLRIGSIMGIGYEKIILLYNEGIYETADVISSFVYRKGLVNYEWSYSTAVGLFNSCINFIAIMIFNKISKKVTEVGLW